MEWFPNHVQDYYNDDTNPDGTAVIEVDVHSKQFLSAIFVKGKTFAEHGIQFSNPTEEKIIKWIEQETGLRYSKQFELYKKENGELHFRECFDGIVVSPTGLIEVNVDENGKLTLFTIHGKFSSADLVKKEEYTLSFDKVEQIAKEQLKLVEFPSFKQEQIIPIYTVDELYIANNNLETIHFDHFTEVRTVVPVNKILTWEEPIRELFVRKETNWIAEVSAEQAFSGEPSPDIYPITAMEKEKCIQAVRRFLQQNYWDESGLWLLKTLHRERGYIYATLGTPKFDNRLFKRKLIVIIDEENFEFINYMDNKSLMAIYDRFPQLDTAVTISKEEAYEKLKEYYSLEPCYVFNEKLKQYILCGKLDCSYALNAANGEILQLEDM